MIAQAPMAPTRATRLEMVVVVDVNHNPGIVAADLTSVGANVGGMVGGGVGAKVSPGFKTWTMN